MDGSVLPVRVRQPYLPLAVVNAHVAPSVTTSTITLASTPTPTSTYTYFLSFTSGTHIPLTFDIYFPYI